MKYYFFLVLSLAFFANVNGQQNETLIKQLQSLTQSVLNNKKVHLVTAGLKLPTTEKGKAQQSCTPLIPYFIPGTICCLCGICTGNTCCMCTGVAATSLPCAVAARIVKARENQKLITEEPKKNH